MSRTIIAIGFVQSLFGILIFVTKRPRHLSFVFLTIWLAVIAAFLGGELLPLSSVCYFKPGLFPAMFLMGPLFYLYVCSLTIEDFRLNPRLLYHLIPFILIAIHRSVVGSVPMTKYYIYNEIYFLLVVLSLTFYWVQSLKLILRHRKNIPFHFSNYTEKNSLTWLIFVLTAFFVFFVVHFSISSISRILGVDIIKTPAYYINFTVFSFIMIFFGINQSAIYKPQRVGITELKPHPNSNGQDSKFVQSSLNKKQLEELTQTVFDYLKREKPYLNPDFSLQMMAEDLNISRQKLSLAINSNQQKNFYKLINEYRVEEVKEKLLDSDYKHFSILGIGLECGFNSKSSFNRIFKLETGLTPTEFKNQFSE